jgi:hypothetical protein
MNAPVESNALLKFQNSEFYSVMGVQELDETAMFDKFVLPNFASMPQGRRVQAVQHIKRCALCLNECMSVCVTW